MGVQKEKQQNAIVSKNETDVTDQIQDAVVRELL
jgi:hypothetical protein